MNKTQRLYGASETGIHAQIVLRKNIWGNENYCLANSSSSPDTATSVRSGLQSNFIAVSSQVLFCKIMGSTYPVLDLHAV